MDEKTKDAISTPGPYNGYPDNNPLMEAPAKLAGGEMPQIIMQKITIRPPYRKETDITDWRNATRSAESIVPRYVWLFDLYEDMWLDGHLNSVASKRIMGVTNADWQFVDAEGKPVDSINDLIDTTAFEDVLTCFVRARLEAYRMLECDYQNGKFSVYIVPPKHMRPRTGYVAFEQTGDAGINIREGIYANTVMEIGKPYDLGLFLSAAQYVIFKRGGLSDWANFVEVFGQPIVDAEWDGFDENQRVQLEEALDKMGNGGKVTRPAGTKINLLENKANANGDLQHKFVDALNKEISKVILGQTETTESSTSSGYAQSETHAGVENDINMSDINYTRRGLNTRFVEILVALGVPGAKGGKFIIKGFDEEDISDKDALEMDIAMVNDLKLPLGDDYFYERYNRPKPDNYDALKKEAQDAANAQLVDLNSDPLKPLNADTPPVSQPKKDKKPKPAEGEPGKKPGKLAKLMLKYQHFFG